MNNLINNLKKFFLISTIYFSIMSVAYSTVNIESDSQSANANNDSYMNKNIAQKNIGVGAMLGFRFNLAEDIFTDLEDKNHKSHDHVFSELEIFANHFLTGEIEQNFGNRLNLGYEIKGIRLYGSGGYVQSKTHYQVAQNKEKLITVGAPFFGLGLGYDFTKNFGIRVNSMFYNFDFKPKDSKYKNVKLSVSSLNFGASLHF